MMQTTTTSADMVSNLSNLLPTGTFLAFQTLAPLFTNNGQCGGTEKVVTALLIGIFEIICFVFNFTDSITTHCGKVYYGIVTSKGLYSPKFKGSGLPHIVDGTFYNDSTGKFLINKFDFINGALNVITFGTLAMLTSPITTCYYPAIPSTILKSVPILVGLTVGMYFAFAPNARQGVGFAILASKDLVPDNHDATRSLTTLKSSKKVDAKASLLEKGDNKDSSIDVSVHLKNARENPTFEPAPTSPCTPAPTPLHRSPNRSAPSHFISQMSPNGGQDRSIAAASPDSSPIHRV